MFDVFSLGAGPGGLLGQQAPRFKPGLELLEGREVPAFVTGLILDDAWQSAVAQIARPAAVAAPAPAAPAPAAPAPAASPGALTEQVTFKEAPTDTKASGTVPMFDPSLGQLRSVDLIASGSLTSNVHLENLEATPVNMKTELNGSIQYQVGNTQLQAAPQRTLEAVVNGFDGKVDLQGASASNFGSTRLDGMFNSLTLTDPADLAPFIGRGTVNVAQSATMTSCASGSGNLAAVVTTTSQGSVKVVYHYTPTTRPPDPSIITPPVQPPSKIFLIDGLEPL